MKKGDANHNTAYRQFRNMIEFDFVVLISLHRKFLCRNKLFLLFFSFTKYLDQSNNIHTFDAGYKTLTIL